MRPAPGKTRFTVYLLSTKDLDIVNVKRPLRHTFLEQRIEGMKG